MKILPTFEEVDQLFAYNQDTGIFTRKVRTAICTKIGDIAGQINAQGYVILKINGDAYKGHRLAWLLHTKVWPTGDIDHIDGNKQNNAISNLRDVQRSVNSLNTKIIQNNSSGYRGVQYHNSKWRARVMLNGKQHIIGSFDTPEDASKAYISFKESL